MRSHAMPAELDALREHSLRPAPRFPTGLGTIDELLGGGLPGGQLTELSGAASSGKATLALGACLRALAAGGAAAWITPAGVFFPLGALEAGFDLDRLLVLHVEGGAGALRGAQLVLGCPGAVSVLVVDLPPGFVPASPQLIKLQRLAQHASCALVFLSERPASAPSLGPAVALRLFVRRTPGTRARTSSIHIDVLRWKSGPSAQAAEETAHGPDRVRVRSTL